MPRDKFQGKYRISTPHLRNWDYRSRGHYFVTICTAGRNRYFGEIKETQDIASLCPTEIGQVAVDNWMQIPDHFPFVQLDEFVVMPDHVHGLLYFNVKDDLEFRANAFGPQSRNLASVIRGYKASVTKHATIHGIDFKWQPRYFNSIIFNNTGVFATRQYIRNNPRKWMEKEMIKDILI